MKSTNICVQGFLDIELDINLSVGYFVWFLFLWQELYSSTYYFTFFITPCHQKFLVTNSTIFYCLPCSSTGILWCNLIISALDFLFLGIYILYIIPLISLYSLSLSIFTSAYFIFSTTLITLLSFTLDCLTFSNKSTPSMITFISFVLLTSNHSSFTSILFSLSLSSPTS